MPTTLLLELEKLISGLSANEKKLFTQLSTRQNGEKDYVQLFELLNSWHVDGDTSLEEVLAERFSGRSLENAVAYLWKTLSNMLLQTRIEQDSWYARHHALMKARLCLERSLPRQATKELKKAQRLAIEAEDLFVHYQAFRMEMTHLTDLGLPDMEEQALIDKQMKGRAMLRMMRQIHEHHSLYQLLTYRLNHSHVLNAENKKKLTDLILGELSFTNRGTRHQFESKKLHLLFQSFFFIQTGEYHGALKIFKELNTLIEAHETMWDFPPYDYLSALRGFLDSLRSIGYYAEMTYFIDRVDKLSKGSYPEHFVHEAMQTFYVYNINMLTRLGRDKEALQVIHSLKKQQFLKNNMHSHEEHIALLFFIALAYFQVKRWSDANKYLLIAIGDRRTSSMQFAYRACRLLHLMVHLELDNLEYLQYNLRNYKRAFSKQGKLFKTEKLVFSLIAVDPKRCSKVKKKHMVKQWMTQIEAIRAKNDESQLTKYADFIGWVEEKLHT